MLDIHFIRDHPEAVKENIKKKYQEEKLPLVDELLSLDAEWRKLKYDEDALRAERNKLSKGVAEAKKAKDEAKAQKYLEKAKEVPKKITLLEEERKDLEEKITELLKKIPNIIHESVPLGKDDTENVELEKVGEPTIPDFEVFNHAELAEDLGGVDFDAARKTSGQGFYYLRGDLSRLHHAMMAYAREFMIEKGFEFVVPPYLIRKEVVEGVMSFAEMDAMMYKIEGEDLYLIGTSEHSMIGMFKDKTLNGKKLPYCMTSFSPCFRKEGGAHGLEEKGFYRVHQFEKQEMIVICEPEESYGWYQKMLDWTVDVFRAWEVPVRKLECCSGDLADLKAKSADVEAWSPRQGKYFEVGSCSNMTDAQARRLGIRVEHKGELYFAHTLNNTVVASPRALIAVMENNQNKDGSITIPESLRPFMGGKEKIEKITHE